MKYLTTMHYAAPKSTAFTGSGKTLTFSLPLVMAALEEELRMPLDAGEGPVGIILAPSRELARQTFEVIKEFCDEISGSSNFPELRAQLVIGGEPVQTQLETLERVGLHCVVATPGRLRVSSAIFTVIGDGDSIDETKKFFSHQDLLKRKSMDLSICRYICLDEADRMLDVRGFFLSIAQFLLHLTTIYSYYSWVLMKRLGK